MDHTVGIIETDISIIPLILKVFAIFQIFLFVYKHNEEGKKAESTAIKCRNCDRGAGLLLKVKTVKEMITKFVLNTKFHHVDLSWIISSTKQMKYDIKENNHYYWLNKGPWYNTAMCWA